MVTIRCKKNAANDSRLVDHHPGSSSLRLRDPKTGGDSLAEAWRIVSGKKLVDLTHTFSPTTPVWQGFGPATFSPAKDPVTGRPYTIDKDGFRALQYSLVGQYGTHIDPPAHFDAHGMTLDELPVKNMILPLIVFDRPFKSSCTCACITAK